MSHHLSWHKTMMTHAPLWPFIGLAHKLKIMSVRCIFPPCLFSHLVEALSSMLSEAIFDFSPAGLTLSAMDPAHVGLAKLELPLSAFEEFGCTISLSVGISLNALSKLVKTSPFRSKTAVVELVVAEGELQINLREPSDVLSVGSFELKLMDIGAEALSVAGFMSNTSVTMSSAAFENALLDLRTLDASSATISVTNGKAFCSASGNEMFSEVGLRLKTSEVVGEDTGVFSLKLLLCFAKAKVLSDTVMLHLSNDGPLCVEYKLGQGKLSYYLAPKLDEDEPRKKARIEEEA